MNNFLNSLIIAIVQGLTEWLPVSSSGHLVLTEKILNYQGSLMFDVALHFGTLMAVFVYFGSDIVDVLRDLLTGKFDTENGRLGIYLAIATIPAALVGFFFLEIFEQVFQSLIITAFGFAITGVILFIASIPKKPSQLNTKSAILIGIAQIISLFPGISRSGTTISAGYILGLKEKQAIKFSFLLSIPIILGANILAIGTNPIPSELIWATLVSFVIGLFTIHLLYGKMLAARKNLKWFAIYTLTLAAAIFGYLVII